MLALGPTAVIHVLMFMNQFFIALNNIGVRYSTAYIHPLVVVSFRYMIGIPLLLLTSFSLQECRSYTPTPHQWKRILLISFIGPFLMVTLLSTSIHLAGPIILGIMCTANPMFVCLISVFVMKTETLNRYKVLGLCLTMLGACIVVGLNGLASNGVSPFDFFLGSLFAIVSVMFGSVNIVLTKPLLSAEENAMPVYFYVSRIFLIGGSGVIIMTLIFYFTEFQTAFHLIFHGNVPIMALAAISYNGSLFTLGSGGLFSYIVKRTTATTSTLYSNTLPFQTAVLAHFLLGEDMLWNQFVGMVVVCGGVVVFVVMGKREENAAKVVASPPLKDKVLHIDDGHDMEDNELEIIHPEGS